MKELTYNYMMAGVRFRVVSNEPLVENWQTQLFADSAEKQPDVCVRVTVTDELPTVSGDLLNRTRETRLYRDGDVLWQETVDRKDDTPLFRCRYGIDAARQVEIWCARAYLPHTVRSWVLWSAIDLPYLMLQHGFLTVHSASVDANGEAILFIAPSGTGKSTQAGLWEKFRGARQLNGDKNLLAVREGGAYACGTPFSGTSEICADFRLPVKAIVLLGQSPENHIRRLKGMPAVMAVLQNCFGHAAVPGCTDRMLEQIGKVLECVPLYALDCTPDKRAVLTLEAELERGK